METKVKKVFYDGQKFTDLGMYSSLETAHAAHIHYKHQQTFEDIDAMDKSIPYIHLMEFRDGEHYNDLYFTWKDLAHPKKYKTIATKDSEIPEHVLSTMFIKGNTYIVSKHPNEKPDEEFVIVEGYFKNSLGGKEWKEQGILKTICREFLEYIQ